jgi:predicted nicotinamide N-methyase
MPRLTPPPEAHITEAYGVHILGVAHREVRRLRRTSDPIAHGTRAWGASYLLMDYLREQPVKKGATVLEVGCGWAPAGIFCAKQFGAKVIGTDIDDKVFPYMEAMAALNGVAIEARVRSFQTLTKRDLTGVNTVIGSDICFWNNLIEPLYGLVQRSLQAGVQRVVLTDPGRAPFHKLCERLEKNRRFKVTRADWFAVEPKRFEGEVVEIRRA